MMLIDMLFAKLFDDYIEILLNQYKHSMLATAFEYSSISNVELHDFTNTNLNNVCIEEEREDWEHFDEDVDVDMYDNEETQSSQAQLKDINTTNINTNSNSNSNSNRHKSLQELEQIQTQVQGDYSPFLASLILLSLTVCNSIGDGIILTLNQPNDSFNLGSIYYRQIIIAFTYGTIMEILDCNSILFCILTLCHSLALPIGLLIGSTYTEYETEFESKSNISHDEQLFYHNNTMFNGFISAIYTGIMIYFSLFHMLPKDLLLSRTKGNTNNNNNNGKGSGICNSKLFEKLLKIFVCICVYIVVIICILKNPMRI